MIFSKKPLKYSPEPLLLNGNPLPWVQKAMYLGDEVTTVMDGLCKDTKVKRARYIERNIEISQEFPSAHPEVKCKINKIYNSSFPGSVLYDLTSDSVRQLVNSWSVSVRHMWGLPLQSHRYLIEPLGGDHALAMLISRFVKFLQNVKRSPKLAAQFMLQKVMNNVNTVTGRNVRMIQDMIGHKYDLMKVNRKWLKNQISFCEAGEDDNWRINFIKEIVNVNQNVLEFSSSEEHESCLTREELEEIIEFVSTS